MKPRAFHLRPGETPEAAIGRLYRYIRELKPDYRPVKHVTAARQMKKANQRLRLVK